MEMQYLISGIAITVKDYYIHFTYKYICSYKCLTVFFQVYFGSQHAKIYLLSDLLGINCVTGMSCLFRKNVLEQAGSLRSLGCYLAEDYHLAKTFIDRYLLHFDRFSHLTFRWVCGTQRFSHCEFKLPVFASDITSAFQC